MSRGLKRPYCSSKYKFHEHDTINWHKGSHPIEKLNEFYSHELNYKKLEKIELKYSVTNIVNKCNQKLPIISTIQLFIFIKKEHKRNKTY